MPVSAQRIIGISGFVSKDISSCKRNSIPFPTRKDTYFWLEKPFQWFNVQFILALSGVTKSSGAGWIMLTKLYTTPGVHVDPRSQRKIWIYETISTILSVPPSTRDQLVRSSFVRRVEESEQPPVACCCLWESSSSHFPGQFCISNERIPLIDL